MTLNYHINSEHKHVFLIENNDSDHIKHLYKTYNDLFPCIKNLKAMNQNFLRYLFIETKSQHRWRKALFYYKNIKTVFTHSAVTVNPGSWSFAPSFPHRVSHFRKEYMKLLTEYYGTIQTLNLILNINFYRV